MERPTLPDISAASEPTLAPSPELTAGEAQGAAAAAAPQRIGSYLVQGKLGEGGMGVVYVAEQQSPRRTVALKVIRPSLLTPKLLRRFEHEAEILGRLQHPNIAQVYEAGTFEAAKDHGPQPFFAMELVRGAPLTAYAAANKLSTNQRLELLAKVCDAVQYAHQNGIIHRDLKPANILVNLTGDPKVLDFGVARVANAGSDPAVSLFADTAPGQLMGTLQYMAPEQAAGLGEVDTRADVYSLGTVLYELLVGMPPLRLGGRSLSEALRVVRDEDPPTLSSVDRRFRGDLDRIVRMAMEKDRARRYQSASELAADLRHHLNGEPIAAHPPSVWYQVRKLARRHKATFVATAAVLVVLVVGVTATTWQAVRATRAEKLAGMRLGEADQARQREEVKRREALAMAEENRQRVYAARINLAEQSWRRGDVGNAVHMLESLRPQGAQEDLRSFEWYHLWRLCHCDRFTVRGHAGPVLAVAHSPDGKTLATGGPDGLKLWDAGTGEPISSLPGVAGEIRSVAFSPDGTCLATGSGAPSMPGMVQLWDPARRVEVRRIEGFVHPVLSVAFSSDGATLATGTAPLAKGVTPLNRLFFVKRGTRPREVLLWDVATGAARGALQGETGGILSVAFSPDRATLAATSWDGTVRLWDLRSGELRTTLTGHTGSVWSAAFSPDGRRLASTSGKWDGQPEVRIWELPAGRERALLKGHLSGATVAAFSPDGTTLATAGWDRTVILWDSESGQSRRTLRGHKSYVSSLAFSPDSQSLLTGSWDGTAKLWQTNHSPDRTPLGGKNEESYSLSFSPEGKLLATTGAGGLHVYNLDTGGKELTIAGQPRQGVVSFSPDGQTLAVVGRRHERGSVRVYDTKTWEVRRELDGHEAGTIWTLAFSPDGKQMATGGADGKARVWDTQTVSELKVFDGRGSNIRALAISPDGKLLAAGNPLGDRGPHLQAWDLSTGSERFSLETGLSECVAFSPDGRLLAVASESSAAVPVVKLWEPATNRLHATLVGHTEVIYQLAFSPDGRTLATGSWDGSIRLWHVITGQPMMTIEARRGTVYSVTFSPDGRTLASGRGFWQTSGMIGEVTLWHAATEAEVRAEAIHSESDLDRRPILVETTAPASGPAPLHMR
jgi:WD40 repeat protein